MGPHGLHESESKICTIMQTYKLHAHKTLALHRLFSRCLSMHHILVRHLQNPDTNLDLMVTMRLVSCGLAFAKTKGDPADMTKSYPPKMAYGAVPDENGMLAIHGYNRHNTVSPLPRGQRYS